ncbi:glycosyltransferase family 28 protein [Salipiger pacificus]|nr:glycosyltransferase family 28 protein [Alloyangia pacifica]MCA0947177.1 glycosyltransferase family 28 protein [Alloyangia pacifica]
MIFATVGTQLPFPRLIDALNAIAPRHGEPVIAQVGASLTEHWANLDARRTLAPQEFSALFSEARVVVSHAGIGSILSARRFGKPLILFPRRAALGEHRNDHQMATVRHVKGLRGVHVAFEQGELERLLLAPGLESAGEDSAPSPAHQALIERLHSFIQDLR